MYKTLCTLPFKRCFILCVTFAKQINIYHFYLLNGFINEKLIIKININTRLTFNV